MIYGSIMNRLQSFFNLSRYTIKFGNRYKCEAWEMNLYYVFEIQTRLITAEISSNNF